MCDVTGKVSYTNKHRARHAMYLVGKSGKKFKNYHAYLCNFCWKWHIGHRR